MRTSGAVLFDSPGEWEIVDIDVDEPRQGELLIEMTAAGLCHSDTETPSPSGVFYYLLSGRNWPFSAPGMIHLSAR